MPEQGSENWTSTTVCAENGILTTAADKGGVIDGHGRLEAAEQRGMDTVPVIRLAHLSPEQARAYRIADNRLAGPGERDHGSHSAKLETLRAADFDVQLTGFDRKALDDLIPAEDAPAMADDHGLSDERQGRAERYPACENGFCM